MCLLQKIRNTPNTLKIINIVLIAGQLFLTNCDKKTPPTPNNKQYTLEVQVDTENADKKPKGTAYFVEQGKTDTTFYNNITNGSFTKTITTKEGTTIKANIGTKENKGYEATNKSISINTNTNAHLTQPLKEHIWEEYISANEDGTPVVNLQLKAGANTSTTDAQGKATITLTPNTDEYNIPTKTKTGIEYKNIAGTTPTITERTDTIEFAENGETYEANFHKEIDPLETISVEAFASSKNATIETWNEDYSQLLGSEQTDDKGNLTETEYQLQINAPIILNYIIKATNAQPDTLTQTVNDGHKQLFDNHINKFIYNLIVNSTPSAAQGTAKDGSTTIGQENAVNNIITFPTYLKRAQSFEGIVELVAAGYNNKNITSTFQPGTTNLDGTMSEAIDSLENITVKATNASNLMQVVVKNGSETLATYNTDTNGNLTAQNIALQIPTPGLPLQFVLSSANADSETKNYTVQDNQTINLTTILNHIYKINSTSPDELTGENALLDINEGSTDLVNGSVGTQLTFKKRAKSINASYTANANDATQTTGNKVLVPGENNLTLDYIWNYAGNIKGEPNANVIAGTLFTKVLNGTGEASYTFTNTNKNITQEVTQTRTNHIPSNQNIDFTKGTTNLNLADLIGKYTIIINNVVTGSQGTLKEGANVLDTDNESGGLVSHYIEDARENININELLTKNGYADWTTNFNIKPGTTNKTANQTATINNYTTTFVFTDELADNLLNGVQYNIDFNGQTIATITANSTQHDQDVNFTCACQPTDQVEIYATNGSTAGVEDKVMTLYRNETGPIASNGNRNTTLSVPISELDNQKEWLIQLSTAMYNDAAFKTHLNGGKEWDHKENGKRTMHVKGITRGYLTDGSYVDDVTTQEMQGIRDRVAILDQNFFDRATGLRILTIDYQEIDTIEFNPGKINIFYLRDDPIPGNVHYQINTSGAKYDHGVGFVKNYSHFAGQLTEETIQAIDYIEDYNGQIGDLINNANTNPSLNREQDLITNYLYVGGKAPKN